MSEIRVIEPGGLVELTCLLVDAGAATEGKWCYFSDDNEVTLQTDADGAAQAAKGVFMETLADGDADRRLDRHVRVLVGGKGVIKTDQVDSSNVPVVGQLVYCDNNALFSSSSTNNTLVGSCLAGADGNDMYTIALLVP